MNPQQTTHPSQVNRGLGQFKQLLPSLMAPKQKGSVDLRANAHSGLFLPEKPQHAVRKTLQKMAREKVHTFLKAFLDHPRPKLPANSISTAAMRCPFPHHALQCHQTITGLLCRCYKKSCSAFQRQGNTTGTPRGQTAERPPRLPRKHALPLPPASRIAHRLPSWN